ncbi:hypothetical protein [Asaia astilbis]|uniref:hypothetical protein n=1 Tax=Asaia astilbis TaxID=610244 RepID=UPI00046FCA8F|nr:hypothetical protein [Asaia astilbis]
MNDEEGLIASERLTLSPRFPVHIGEFDNRDGSSRETEPLVPLAKALDYAAALVTAERERCANRLADVAKNLGRHWGSHLTEEGIAIKEACAARVEQEAAAIREGGEG